MSHRLGHRWIRYATGWVLLFALLIAVMPSHHRAQGYMQGVSNADSHQVATAWFTLLEESMRQTPGYSPPVAAHILLFLFYRRIAGR